MKQLYKTISRLGDMKRALGHFNIATLEQLKAVVNVSKRLNAPVIIGVSEGEREFIGINQVVALIESYRREGLEVYLNADHTKSLKGVEEVAHAGFDSITFDRAELPFEENIRETKEAMKIVKKFSSFNHKILLEGELGYIGVSSKLLDEIPKGAAVEGNMLTSPEEAKEFMEKTGIHMLAPAVGNIHGMLKNMKNPRLDIGRIEEISKSCGIPLVLHGGSGISDEDFVSAIKAGVSIVHISTELRVSWKKGIEETLKEDPDELAPYRVLKKSISNIESVTEERIELFMNLKI